MDGRFKGCRVIAQILAVIAGVALAQTPVDAAMLPKPTHTNKTRFRIPFKFDSTALQRMNAREIQLHVSRDHGATWELAQTLTPDGGKFEFQAAGDGEYWFSVKTLDGRDQLHPPRGSYETGLIVVVDTTEPVLNILLEQSVAGQLQLNWRASDTNLDIDTLRIECQTSGSKDWDSIPLVPRKTGEHSWTVNQSGVVSIRGTVADTAGNVGHSQTQLSVNAAAGAPNDKTRPTRRGPIAEDDLNSTRQELQSASLPQEHATVEPDDHGPIITPRGRPPQYQRPVQRMASTSRSEIPEERPVTTAPEPFQFSNASLESRREIPNPPNPVLTQNQSQPFVQAPPYEPQPQPQPQPRRLSSRQRVVATRHFQIGYKLDDIGPSGVGGVELFITEDNGRKWWKYGDDPDQKSPFDVEVPRDGVYGFAIRVRSGAGLSNDPPVPGESPAIVIAVDQTAPLVEMLPIQQGQGNAINRLLIRWKVVEEHPAEKPVSLYYAANPNGPWEPISGWKDDLNGSFEWTVGAGVPSEFYVRVMVRDVAGNVGKAETQLPIVVDLQRPTARIVDVEVVPGSVPQ